MKVHEAAMLLGVTPRALRYYEQKGLIKPWKEEENGYRAYSEEDIERLRWIVSLRELGLPLIAIADILDSLAEPDAFFRKVDGARAALYEEWLDMEKALRSLDDALSDWQRSGEADLLLAERAAEQMRRTRQLRSSWSDQWNYDELASRYGEFAPLVHIEAMLTKEQYYRSLVRTADWLDPQPGELGLELGAGSGNLTALLAAGGARLTVIEQSARMLAILRNRLPDVEARQGNLLALPLAGHAYAFIGCSFALHHLNQSQQLLALEEMDRVLRIGGRLALTGFMEESRGQSGGQASPSSLPELIGWLERRSYATVHEKLYDGTHLLFAVKP
ncbi:MerR family transcriptional regulator [Paenibacillus arenilitoris]|uniref:MerR family transcriptional regulator n=1 Tax=Paenibacillus arenilitoris TaxID=2772299 RepID=A0A927CP58_9BACL|nr:MerR family transcriptional regulator [Paenibacillus arenilitoris]MBD2869706.1 MerR family transcriptional regulator [Paenibacillus arenilitoris]